MSWGKHSEENNKQTTVEKECNCRICVTIRFFVAQKEFTEYAKVFEKRLTKSEDIVEEMYTIVKFTLTLHLALADIRTKEEAKEVLDMINNCNFALCEDIIKRL